MEADKKLSGEQVRLLAALLNVNNKEEITKRLNFLKDRLRAITHRMNLVLHQGHQFNDLVIGLFEYMKALIQVQVVFTPPDKNPDFSHETVVHLYRILQELLTNAVKYVKEGEIHISMSLEQSRFFIFYSDTGCGFDASGKTTSDFGDHGDLQLCPHAP